MITEHALQSNENIHNVWLYLKGNFSLSFDRMQKINKFRDYDRDNNFSTYEFIVMVTWF